jgi:hypothetical protein
MNCYIIEKRAFFGQSNGVDAIYSNPFNQLAKPYRKDVFHTSGA